MHLYIVDIHPDRPDQRGIQLPNGEMMLLPTEPTIESMINRGGTTATYSEAHKLCNGFFFGSGAIERITKYETGLHGHHTFRGKEAIPDPMIMDERYLAAHVRGRRLSVLSCWDYQCLP